MPEPAAPCSDYPAWVFLDTLPLIGWCNDVTAARTRTSAGDVIEVSFDVAAPPALSRCFVHCPGLAEDVFSGQPSVTGAEGALLLLRVPFADRGGTGMFTDIFVYKAGPGKPSLHLLPRPYPVRLHSNCVGILPCGGGDYIVAVPEPRFERGYWKDYNLHIFSSQSNCWSIKVARLAPGLETDLGKLVEHEPTKVVSTGEGSLGWIDLRWGVVVCNVVDPCPEMSLVPLPQLLPTNKIDFGIGVDGEGPPLRQIRDVTCKDGYIRVIEVEFPDLDDTKMDLRWTATMFERMIGSEKWVEGCSVDSAHLIPADLCLPYIYPGIWDSRNKKLTLNKVLSSAPTLDLYDSDVVYMMSKMNTEDANAWVLAVNTRSGTLEKVAPFSAERMHYFNPTYQQCAFSEFLRSAPVAYTVDLVKGNISKEHQLPFVLFVVSVLLTRRQLRILEDGLTYKRPCYQQGGSLFHPSLEWALNANFKELIHYGSSDSLGEVASEESIFLQAVEDTDSLLLRDSPAWKETMRKDIWFAVNILNILLGAFSSCEKIMQQHISVAVGALDNILQKVPCEVLGIGRSAVASMGIGVCQD